jgi:CRISPR-associated exonuclease Cas4
MDFVKVSDVITYLRCPRMVYFASKGHKLVGDITQAHIERMILKELALIYPLVILEKDILSRLNEELRHITSELKLIYRVELEKIEDTLIEKAASSLKEGLGTIRDSLVRAAQELGLESFLAHITPIELEPNLYSSKLALAGNPTKLVKIGNKIIPSIIKTGKTPANGVWQRDRIQLTAYAMLAEEKYGTINKGIVEYARSGQYRMIGIRSKERRMVLQIREKIRKIQGGAMPERPATAPCKYCNFYGICEVKSTLASRFF